MKSPKDKRAYANALDLFKYWETIPKTYSESLPMMSKLPPYLSWVYQHGWIRHDMVKYIQNQLKAMETEDQPIAERKLNALKICAKGLV